MKRLSSLALLVVGPPSLILVMPTPHRSFRRKVIILWYVFWAITFSITSYALDRLLPERPKPRSLPPSYKGEVLVAA